MEVRVLSPRPTTLVVVYLRAGDGLCGEVGVGKVIGDGGVPGTRLAPGFPVARMLRYEVTRVLDRLAFPLAVAVPGVLAASRIMGRRASADGDIEQVASGKLMDAVSVTAYEAMGRGLQSSLFLVMLLVVGLASQSLAGDLSSGTLRNVLLRPLRRVQVVAGKALGQGLALLAFYGFVVLVSWVTAVWYFDFGDLVYLGDAPELIVKGSELGGLVPGLLLYPVAPLLAYLGIGFLAGAVLRKGVWALALALGMVLLLDQLRILGGEWLYLLPSAYLPSPSGDATSYLPYYLEANAGQLGARFLFASTAVVVPLMWSVVTFSLAALVLQRRSVP